MRDHEDRRFRLSLSVAGLKGSRSKAEGVAALVERRSRVIDNRVSEAEGGIWTWENACPYPTGSGLYGSSEPRFSA